MTSVYKVILIGDIDVGKSSFFVRFRDGKFVENLFGTIGLDQTSKEIAFTSDGTTTNKANIQLWDTAGLEKAGRLTNNYYTGSRAVILMYDVTEWSSYNCLQVWLDETIRYTRQAPVPLFFLVGNKIDCTSSEIEVTEESVKQFAEKRNIPLENLYRISVKSGKHFQTFLSSMAKSLSAKVVPAVQKDQSSLFNKHTDHQDGSDCLC